jgi:hypothetical protein
MICSKADGRLKFEIEIKMSAMWSENQSILENTLPGTIEKPDGLPTSRRFRRNRFLST